MVLHAYRSAAPFLINTVVMSLKLTPGFGKSGTSRDQCPQIHPLAPLGGHAIRRAGRLQGDPAVLAKQLFLLTPSLYRTERSTSTRPASDQLEAAVRAGAASPAPRTRPARNRTPPSSTRPGHCASMRAATADGAAAGRRGPASPASDPVHRPQRLLAGKPPLQMAPGPGSRGFVVGEVHRPSRRRGRVHRARPTAASGRAGRPEHDEVPPVRPRLWRRRGHVLPGSTAQRCSQPAGAPLRAPPLLPAATRPRPAPAARWLARAQQPTTPHAVHAEGGHVPRPRPSRRPAGRGDPPRARTPGAAPAPCATGTCWGTAPRAASISAWARGDCSALSCISTCGRPCHSDSRTVKADPHFAARRRRLQQGASAEADGLVDGMGLGTAQRQLEDDRRRRPRPGRLPPELSARPKPASGCPRRTEPAAPAPGPAAR